MERAFGVAVYLLGLLMVVTMIMRALNFIDRPGSVATIAFLFFGYVLCVTGFLFVRRSPPSY